MRGNLTLAVLLGIVLLLASLPIAAVVALDGTHLRSLSTGELFVPGARWQRNDLSLAIPMWLTIAACVGAVIVALRNLALIEPPQGFRIAASGLLAGVTIAASVVVLIGAARLADDADGVLGAGPALLLGAAASYAYFAVASLRAHEHGEPQYEIEGQ